MKIEAERPAVHTQVGRRMSPGHQGGCWGGPCPWLGQRVPGVAGHCCETAHTEGGAFSLHLVLMCSALGRPLGAQKTGAVEGATRREKPCPREVRGDSSQKAWAERPLRTTGRALGKLQPGT